MAIDARDLKQELRSEYYHSMKILEKYSAGSDAKKAQAANRILNDKDLLITFVELRYERNQSKFKQTKKEKNKLTGWRKFVKLSLDQARCSA